MKQCALCHIELPKISFYDALIEIAEYIINFPEDPFMRMPVDKICDDCYKEFITWYDS